LSEELAVTIERLSMAVVSTVTFGLDTEIRATNVQQLMEVKTTADDGIVISSFPTMAHDENGHIIDLPTIPLARTDAISIARVSNEELAKTRSRRRPCSHLAQ
jgi:hypothetical protein